MQKARRHPLTGSDRLQAYGFRYYFTPLFGVLFTFPLRYWFTIDRQGVFSLTGWYRQIQTGFLWSRPTQDTTRPVQFPLTQLSCSMAPLSRGFCLMYVSKSSPTTPILHARLVWALPRSLATTWGIICYFLFLRVLRCFSSPGWLSLLSAMSSTQRVVPFGNLRIYRSCAAPRSLSQLTTSFFASCRLGIHHTPLIALNMLFSVAYSIPLGLGQKPHNYYKLYYLRRSRYRHRPPIW